MGLDFFVRKPRLIRQMKTAHVKPLHSPKLKASRPRRHPVQYALKVAEHSLIGGGSLS